MVTLAFREEDEGKKCRDGKWPVLACHQHATIPWSAAGFSGTTTEWMDEDLVREVGVARQIGSRRGWTCRWVHRPSRAIRSIVSGRFAFLPTGRCAGREGIRPAGTDAAAKVTQGSAFAVLDIGSGHRTETRRHTRAWHGEWKVLEVVLEEARIVATAFRLLRRSAEISMPVELNRSPHGSADSGNSSGHSRHTRTRAPSRDAGVISRRRPRRAIPPLREGLVVSMPPSRHVSFERDASSSSLRRRR